MEIQEVMTRQVQRVTPDTPLKAVAALLVEHSISGLPVCEDGRVLGVVSETDILFKERGPDGRRARPLAWLLDGPSAEERAKATARTAGQAMTAPPVTIAPYRPVAAAARLMLDRRVNRLPVVKDERLVGIVTRSDLVRAFQRSDVAIADEIRRDILERTLWLTPADVGVLVRAGEVNLRGEVERRSDAELLPTFVARVPGVVGVRSDVTWRTDDAGIRVAAGRR